MCAGGVHADKHSPQPHDLPLSPAHPASPCSTERTPQHRPDPAGGRHGRQLRGKKKIKGLRWTDLKKCLWAHLLTCTCLGCVAPMVWWWREMNN